MLVGGPWVPFNYFAFSLQLIALENDDFGDLSDLCPDMCDPSTVLSPEMAKALFAKMPPKIQSQPWKLAFSTQTDGFSLQVS